MRRIITLAFVIGIFLSLGLAVLVGVTGATFGQRCERIFPTDPQRAATCVDNLAAGRPA